MYTNTYLTNPISITLRRAIGDIGGAIAHLIAKCRYAATGARHVGHAGVSRIVDMKPSLTAVH